MKADEQTDKVPWLDQIYGYGPERDAEGMLVPVTNREWFRRCWEEGLDEAVKATGWSRAKAAWNSLSPSQQGVLWALGRGDQPINHEDEPGEWADETEWKGLTVKNAEGLWEFTEWGAKVAAIGDVDNP